MGPSALGSPSHSRRQPGLVTCWPTEMLTAWAELGALPAARTSECPCRLFIGVCILQPFLLPLRLYSCGRWVLQGLVGMDLWRSISPRAMVYLSGGLESRCELGLLPGTSVWRVFCKSPLPARGEETRQSERVCANGRAHRLHPNFHLHLGSWRQGLFSGVWAHALPSRSMSKSFPDFCVPLLTLPTKNSPFKHENHLYLGETDYMLTFRYS